MRPVGWELVIQTTAIHSSRPCMSKLFLHGEVQSIPPRPDSGLALEVCSTGGCEALQPLPGPLGCLLLEGSGGTLAAL